MSGDCPRAGAQACTLSCTRTHRPRASLAGRANSDTFDMTPRLVSHSDQCLLILTFPIRACFLLGLGVQRAWAQSVPHVHLALHTTHL